MPVRTASPAVAGEARRSGAQRAAPEAQSPTRGGTVSRRSRQRSICAMARATARSTWPG